MGLYVGFVAISSLLLFFMETILLVEINLVTKVDEIQAFLVESP